MSVSKVVALIGMTGSGMTTLFNRLTGAKEKTSWGGKSITKEIVRGVDQFEGAFLVLDTPGFGSEQDKLLHAACVLAAVSCQDIHQILLVIKHSSYNQIKSDIKTLIEPFKRYRSAVSIYISWFDICKNPKEEQENLRKNIENDFNINKVIFYEANASDKSMAAKVRQTLQNSKNLRIQLLENEIFTCFDYLELTQEQEELSNDEILIRCEKFCQQVKMPIHNFLRTLKAEDPLYFLILEKLQQFANGEAQKYMVEFENEFQKEMQNWFQHGEEHKQQFIFIKFKKNMKTLLENIQLAIIQFITRRPEIIQEYLQACPHCDQIWVKSLTPVKRFLGNSFVAQLSSDQFDNDKVQCKGIAGNYYPKLGLMDNQISLKLVNEQLKIETNYIRPFTNEEEIINKLKEEIQNGYFQNVYQVHKLKMILREKFGMNCFQIWLKLLDQNDFSKFKENLLQELEKTQFPSYRSQVGCERYFYWNYKFLLANIIGQEKLIPVDFDPLKSYTKENDVEMAKFIQEQQTIINYQIIEQHKKIKIIEKIENKGWGLFKQ